MCFFASSEPCRDASISMRRAPRKPGRESRLLLSRQGGSEIAGGDARRGHTRPHSEHEGQALRGRGYYIGDDVGEQVAAGFPFGDVAQLGEHLPCKQGVESSNLFVSILAAP